MSIRICSFNLRYEKGDDGINVFPNRKNRILETIRTERPDVIGFQETMEGARAFLTESLHEYTVLGCGRLPDLTGEGVTLAFRKDKFDILGYDAFWLSATPAVPGSYYGGDQSHNPRMAQIVHLIPRDGSHPFVFCNTHLDDLGKNARLSGSIQILQALSRYPDDMPLILTGDFNALPSDPEITVLGQWMKGRLKDVTASITETFHGFGKRIPGSKIDYIFTTGTAVTPAYTAEDKPLDGVYSSDHYAVVCDVAF